MSATLRASKMSANAANSAALLNERAGAAKLSMSLPISTQYEVYMQEVLAQMSGDAIARWVNALGTSPEEKARAVLDFCKQARRFQAKKAAKAKNDMNQGVSDESARVIAARRLEMGNHLQVLVNDASDC